MKKIISFCFASFLLTFVAIGQDANMTSTKKQCTPNKECAEKMGMTLEQCKALCKKACSKSTSTAAESAAESQLVNADIVKSNSTPKCCASIEECAAKMGMTVEECRAKCKAYHGSKASTTTSSVASAVMVSSSDEAPVANASKKSCSAKKACCKKKQ